MRCRDVDEKWDGVVGEDLSPFKISAILGASLVPDSEQVFGCLFLMKQLSWPNF
jgi:hypothetical protein